MSTPDNSKSQKRAAWLYYAGCYKRQNHSLVLTVLLCVMQFVFVLPTIYLVRHVFDVVIPRGDLRGVFWDAIAIAACQTIYTAFSLWVRSVTLQPPRLLSAQSATICFPAFTRFRGLFTAMATAVACTPSSCRIPNEST